MSVMIVTGFKGEQKKFKRVRDAYAEKESGVKALLAEKSIQPDQLEIYLRAFKSEQQLELWGRNRGGNQFQLLKTYSICQTCGVLGPKRKQGDLQIPEGFYHINAFNPTSKFHLSMRLNYPNQSDKVLSDKKYPGGDIYIHGDCVTIGCLPITDEQIKELYIICVEAKNNGQNTIPVTMFPARLTDDNFHKLRQKYKGDTDRINLWNELKKGYDLFNQNKQLFSVKFLPDGRHQVK
ncbi:L,D-transpeptidase family protein [Carboxylicivirga linearis]|uniref:L,D-transpeptidase family protein n=1 Tax=Carboxylicivirga linearis TaxID=1628157 RepID=A0ABS5JWL1_9BACT|nr:L,D-transpeptidase family protein [Carboxylicivirga linearis]MBS2099299.1 L,D-transpeptidase family protein [Carboxylicivirga linearis]